MEAIAIDWPTVEMTTSAKNAKTPLMHERVVVVPRRVCAKYGELPWTDTASAAAQQIDGLFPLICTLKDRPTIAQAYLREGLKGDHALKGMSLLFMQGWGLGD